MKNRRKRRFASHLHRKYIFRFALTSFLFTLFILFMLLIPPYIMMTHGGESEEAFRAAQEFLYLALKISPAILILLGGLILLETYFSHKVFGPLVRLNQWLMDLQEGDLSDRGTFRKGDLLKKEAQLFLEALHQLRQPIIEAQKVIEEEKDPQKALEKVRKLLSFYKF